MSSQEAHHEAIVGRAAPFIVSGLEAASAGLVARLTGVSGGGRPPHTDCLKDFGKGVAGAGKAPAKLGVEARQGRSI